jgi:hypothetical protein
MLLLQTFGGIELKLQVPRLEVSADEAKRLMEAEGEEKLIMEDEKHAHIWVEGSSPYALQSFDLERNPDGQWGWKDRAPGWVGRTARGWRTKNWEIFSRVELIYVGEEKIRDAYLKMKDRTQMQLDFWNRLPGMSFRMWPEGAPTRTSQRTGPTVEELENMDEQARYRALFDDIYHLGLRESVMNGVAIELDHWSNTGLILKVDMEKALVPLTKDAKYKTVMLSDLHEYETTEYWTDFKIYAEAEGKASFKKEMVDKVVRVFYPRKTRRVAFLIIVHYPDKSMPCVLTAEGSKWAVLVAPLSDKSQADTEYPDDDHSPPDGDSDEEVDETTDDEEQEDDDPND